MLSVSLLPTESKRIVQTKQMRQNHQNSARSFARLAELYAHNNPNTSKHYDREAKYYQRMSQSKYVDDSREEITQDAQEDSVVTTTKTSHQRLTTTIPRIFTTTTSMITMTPMTATTTQRQQIRKQFAQNREEQVDIELPSYHYYQREMKRGEISSIKRHPTNSDDDEEIQPGLRREYSYCRTKSSTLWRVPPRQKICAKSAPLHWKKASFYLYSKTAHPVKIPCAYMCMIKKEGFKYHTNLLGERFGDPTIKQETVTSGECHDFAKTHKCAYGSLTQKSTRMFSTDNKMKVDYPGKIMGFFKGTQYTNTTNCLVESVDIYYHHTNLHLFSPIHQLDHCSYPDGKCITIDNMTLVWTPQCPRDGCNRCMYERIRKEEGMFTNETFWIPKDHLGLTFEDSPPTAIACNDNQIVISIQGYGISQKDYSLMQKTGSRRRRIRESATTEELAAELTAEELRMMEILEQTNKLLCKTLDNYERDATATARQMLGNRHVMAKWRSEEILEVFQCAAIDSSAMRPRKSEKCYLYMPVEIYWPPFDWINAYLDTKTFIISGSSPEADCTIHSIHYLDLGQGLLKHNSMNNETTTILEINIQHPPIELYEPFDYHIDAFHDLILTNDTEIFEQIFNGEHIDELERVNQFRNKIDVEKTQATPALSETPHSISGMITVSFFNWLWWIHAVWINICAIFVSLQIALVIAYWCLPSAFFAPIRAFRKLQKQRRRKRKLKAIEENHGSSDESSTFRPTAPKRRLLKPKLRDSNLEKEVNDNNNNEERQEILVNEPSISQKKPTRNRKPKRVQLAEPVVLFHKYPKPPTPRIVKKEGQKDELVLEYDEEDPMIERTEVITTVDKHPGSSTAKLTRYLDCAVPDESTTPTHKLSRASSMFRRWAQ
jgi:hypothetical protein